MAAQSQIIISEVDPATTIQGINSRVLGYRNGDLYYWTGSGVTGIYKYPGTPTSPTTSTAFLTGMYWTTPTDLFSATDAGAAAIGTSIHSTGANYALPGVDSLSVPEPTVAGLAGPGAALALSIRRSGSERAAQA